MSTSELVEAFVSQVWEALKGDHNDLRREQIILRAFREAQQAAAARLEELERENARMREALKPFIRAVQMVEAKTYNRGDDPAPDNHMAAPSLGITLGDLRRAAALAGSGEK